MSRMFSALAYCGVYLCSGYMLNNLHDREEDPESKNRFKVMPERTSRRVTLGLHAALALVAAINDLVPESLSIVALNLAYSARPVRLKRFLPASLFCNGLFFAFPYYVSAKIVADRVDSGAFQFAGYVFLIFLPLQYLHHLEHVEDSGTRAGLGLRLGSIAFLALPCIYTALPALEPLHRFHAGTVAFSVAALIAVLALRSAASARVAVRVLGLVLGVFLI